MVEIKELSKSFLSKKLKRIAAVDNVSLTLDNGVYGLLGPNGSGKTTLLRCIMGLYNYKGTVTVDSKTLSKNPDCVKKIGYLPQQFDMFKELTLFDMMSYYAALKGINRKQREDAVEKVLKTVNLEEKKNCRVKTLSGGMKRRAGIAQALLGEPSLIILDEPTTGLDVEERIRFKNIIGSISRDTIVILSTHIIEDVETLCDNIIVMHEGKILIHADRNSIAENADGKVYEFEYGTQPKNIEFERIYEISGKKYVKILSSSKLNAKPLKPTVEDGYLCYIKGI